MRKKLLYLLSATILATSVIAMSGCGLYKKTNDGKVDLKWYMGLTYEDEQGQDKEYTVAKGEEIAAVALENSYSEQYAIVKDGEIFLNIDTITDDVDRRFYWDKQENKVMFTNATQIYEADINKNIIRGKETENTGYTIAFVENKKCYINIKFVKKFIDLDYKKTDKKEKSPAIISLKYRSGKKTTMAVSDDIEMRTKGDYQNLIVTVVKEDTRVTLLESGKNWSRVKTDTGYIGYIPTGDLEDEKTEEIKRKNDDSTYTHVLKKDRISLAWNQIYNQTANSNIDGLLKNTSGINVLSPTWFSLTDKKGNLSTLADLQYVEKAHKRGMEVWALVNDFTDKKLTKAVLTSTTLRQKLVKNIMYFADSYELDGINIDFEYITEDIADSYLQFLRELSIECRKAKKVLSIDNYAPAQWSGYYDREQQLKIADYIIIMNYDEHTAGSKEAGSVSSMPYAEKSIKDTIAEAKDAKRIINGMPFYTRVWKEVPEEDSDGSGVFIEDAAGGNYYLSSEAVNMKTAEKNYKDAGVKPAFDEKTGQNYVTYSKGNAVYMIWLEDATSVRARLELIKKYDLAGAAYWALGQEKDNIWKVIGE